MGLKSFFKKIFGHGGEKGGAKEGPIITPPSGGCTPRRDKNPDGYTGGGNLEYYDLARKKIENGDPLGWRMLEVCCENGWVLKRNPTEAERCREIASELEQRAWENAETEEDDGPKGSIVPPSNSDPKEYLYADPKEYLWWHLCYNNGSPHLKSVYTKIEHGNPAGWKSLGHYYKIGSYGLPKNSEMAEKCSKMAQCLGEKKPAPKPSTSKMVPPSNSDPKEYLWWHLRYNNGSPYLKLVYTKIEHGDPAGWKSLGHCYKIGSYGLPKNSEMAEKCSKMAQCLGEKKPAPKPSTPSGDKERPGGSVPPEITLKDLSTVEHSPFHVSMVAPSGFGKTTLLVTIMNSAQNKMDNPKKGLKVACKDKDDEKRLKDAQNKLNDDIMAGAEGFTSKVTPTLPGTGEPKKFNFYFQQAEEEASFRQPFSIMDIPGGWINPNNRITDEMNIKWEDFKEHLHVSRLLFVPIDATLIMEYGTDKEQVAAVKILDSGSTSDLIKEWAKYRKGELEETGRISALFFVPVKCEKYRSKAKELETRVKQFFANTASQVHDICSDIQQYYIPLETLGCVEFAHGKWETEEGKEEFSPVFHKVNKDAYLQPKNVEILFAMMYKMAAQELEITMDKFAPKDKEEFQGIIAPLMKELKSNGDISSIEKHRINWW